MERKGSGVFGENRLSIMAGAFSPKTPDPVVGRQSTRVPGLDDLLGGGLIPGTLTVVVGATGIGKTQLGLQFAHAGQEQEKRRGVIFDCSSRGDSQSHAQY